MNIRIVLVIAAALALAGCSSGPDMSDNALAEEMSRVVYGQSLDDAVGGEDAAREASVQAAEAHCEALRSAADLGAVHVNGSASSNREFLREYELRTMPWDVDQVRQMMIVSAKYRCPEFTSMLQVYRAATPTG